MTTHLFLFTIGPVQSFIAQARKTQDLYAGSKILSELITVAMETLENKYPTTEFIFPTDLKATSKPNRFTAVVTTDKDIQTLGNEVKKAVESHFVNVLGEKVLILQPDSITQLNDFLKVYWVAHEVTLDASGKIINYATQIKQAEKLLGATKNIRYFSQLEEKGRKCALNGEYNVKFYRKTQDEFKENIDVLGDKKKLFHSAVKVVNPQVSKDIQKKHLQQGEGLCAVSMVKRFFEGEDKIEFPSTSEIATMNTLKILREKDVKLRGDINCLLAIDEQFIYEEAITPKNFKRITEENGQKIDYDYARNLQKNIADAAKAKNLVLSKYYAILVFDADGMGSKLGACKNKEEHQKLSELLGKYGQNATKYIDDNKLGKTVYAGGDDFLGLLNLNHLFEAMQVLREMFNTEVNAKLPEHLKLTFSAGVAIAHYKTPLSEVLNYARAMEKKSKKIENKSDANIKKDAFSIAVLKHSGEIHDTTFRWTDDNCHWSAETLKVLTNHLKNKDISDKFITNLSETFAKLLDKNGNWWFDKTKQNKIFQQQEDSLNVIFKCELERFAKRAKTEGATINIKGFCDNLYALYSNHLLFDLNLQNFLNALHICEFIGRHLNKTIFTTQNQQESESISNTVS